MPCRRLPTTTPVRRRRAVCGRRDCSVGASRHRFRPSRDWGRTSRGLVPALFCGFQDCHRTGPEFPLPPGFGEEVQQRQRFWTAPRGPTIWSRSRPALPPRCESPGICGPEQMVGPIRVHPTGRFVYLGNRAGPVETQGKKVAIAADAIHLPCRQRRQAQVGQVYNIEIHGITQW
jgi:hypothetical protein